MSKGIKTWGDDDLETMDGWKLCLIKKYHIEKEKIEGKQKNPTILLDKNFLKFSKANQKKKENLWVDEDEYETDEHEKCSN